MPLHPLVIFQITKIFLPHSKFSVSPEKFKEYLKAAMPNITQITQKSEVVPVSKPEVKDQPEDDFETKLKARILQENIDAVTKLGKQIYQY